MCVLVRQEGRGSVKLKDKQKKIGAPLLDGGRGGKNVPS